MPKRARWLLLVGLLVLLSGFAGGYAARQLIMPKPNVGFSLVQEAYGLLEAHFMEPLPPGSVLEHGMIRGMLEAVGDPYTLFLEPASHELLSDTLAGEYGGIGVVLTRDQAGRLHLVPSPGGPAALAGIVEGDVLLAIDGQPVGRQAPAETVGAALRGLVGTTVHLRIAGRAPSQGALLFEIVRQSILLPTVVGYVSPDWPDVGVLVISGFSERTHGELSGAYDSLIQRQVQRLVVDLRGNPGGLLDAGVAVARFFLESGVVVIEQTRGQADAAHRASEPGPACTIPLAVVVDRSTASAAEIVAGALQDNHRAPLVGEATYGKSSVQLIFELQDGSSIHVTSARWLTPSGRRLDGIGLDPDLVVRLEEAAPDQDLALEAAIGWLLAADGPSP